MSFWFQTLKEKWRLDMEIDLSSESATSAIKVIVLLTPKACYFYDILSGKKECYIFVLSDVKWNQCGFQISSLIVPISSPLWNSDKVGHSL